MYFEESLNGNSGKPSLCMQSFCSLIGHLYEKNEMRITECHLNPRETMPLFVKEGGSDHDLGDLVRIDVRGWTSVLEVALSSLTD